MSPQQFEAQVNQVGVEHIGLAVIADAREAPLEVRAPNFRAVHADFSRKPQQGCDVVQAGAPPPLETRENIHQIHVPPMEPAQVVAESETMIGIAHFPVACGGHAVQETAVVQHRQIESGAVPGNQVRREFVQAVEEALDQYLLRRRLIAEAPQLQRIPGAHDHGDGDDAVLLVRKKFAAGFLAALGEHDLRHLFIGQIMQIVQTAPKIRIGHGLDIEDQGVHAGTRRMSTATATTRPASSVRVTWPSPIPKPSRTLAPRAE